VTARASRRRLLATAALAGSGLAVPGRARAGQDGATPPAPAPGRAVGQADTPRWTFVVVALLDPYPGQLTRPQEPDPALRYVATEVQILNASDQPLEFSASDVRLRDEQGVEYAGGSVAGSEPRLVGQNLPGGERTRGWLWFGVPKDVLLTELRLSAPSPQLRVPLSSSGSG
jgi:hypothetical protein